MSSGMMYDITRFAFILITCCTMVNAAVAYRLSDADGKGKDFTGEDILITLKSDHSSAVDTLNHYIHTVPVQHFARHGLCGNEEGRQYFYKAVKTKLCQIQGTFISDLVEGLCKHQGPFLDEWVSELFDIDGDGMLTHLRNNFINLMTETEKGVYGQVCYYRTTKQDNLFCCQRRKLQLQGT